MNISNDLNLPVLDYLSRFKNTQDAALVEAIEPGRMEHAGTHPEVVERVWQELGKDLPSDCRALIKGTPALVNPETGIIFVLALGTRYALRLPGKPLEWAIQEGCRTVAKWTYGGELDTRSELGKDWVIGAWLKNEIAWVREAFAFYGQAGLAGDLS